MKYHFVLINTVIKTCWLSAKYNLSTKFSMFPNQENILYLYPLFKYAYVNAVP